jgi:hypothetical protein
VVDVFSAVGFRLSYLARGMFYVFPSSVQDHIRGNRNFSVVDSEVGFIL